MYNKVNSKGATINEITKAEDNNKMVISKDVYDNVNLKGEIISKITKAKDNNKKVISKDMYDDLKSKGGIISVITKAKDDNVNMISKDAYNNGNARGGNNIRRRHRQDGQEQTAQNQPQGECLGLRQNKQTQSQCVQARVQ